MVPSSLDLQTKLNSFLDADLKRVDVVFSDHVAVCVQIVMDFLDQLLIDLFLLLFDRHALLPNLLVKVHVVGDALLVDVGLMTRLDSVLHSSNEWLVHHVLVPEVRHLVAGGRVDIASELLLLFLLGLLRRPNPLLVLAELLVAHFHLAFMLFALWALKHVVVALGDGAEHVSNLVLAVD